VANFYQVLQSINDLDVFIFPPSGGRGKGSLGTSIENNPHPTCFKKKISSELRCATFANSYIVLHCLHRMKRATFGLSEEHTTSSTEWFGMKVDCWHWFVFRSFWAHSAKLRCCPWTVVTFKTNHPKKSISAGQLSTHSRLSRFFFVSCRWGRSLQTFFFGIQISRFVAQYVSICHFFLQYS